MMQVHSNLPLDNVQEAAAEASDDPALHMAAEVVCHANPVKATNKDRAAPEGRKGKQTQVAVQSALDSEQYHVEEAGMGQVD